jgi:small membrane protein
MAYLPLQIIVTLSVVVVVWRLVNKFKENNLKLSEFIGWLVIWLLVVIVFWLPQTASYFARLFGIGRGVDLAVYVAILMLFYLVFKLYLKIDNQRKEITKIVRQLALDNQLEIKEKENQKT